MRCNALWYQQFATTAASQVTPTHSQKAGQLRHTQGKILYRGTSLVKPRGKKPPAKLHWTDRTGNRTAGHVLSSGSKRSKRESAAHPIHPSQPCSTKKTHRLSSSWLINIGPFFSQRLPASQQFLRVAFLPYKLLAGAELIWSQWELLSSFLKETKPGVWLRDAQRPQGLGWHPKSQRTTDACHTGIWTNR